MEWAVREMKGGHTFKSTEVDAQQMNWIVQSVMFLSLQKDRIWFCPEQVFLLTFSLNRSYCPRCPIIGYFDRFAQRKRIQINLDYEVANIIPPSSSVYNGKFLFLSRVNEHIAWRQ